MSDDDNDEKYDIETDYDDDSDSDIGSEREDQFQHVFDRSKSEVSQPRTKDKKSQNLERMGRLLRTDEQRFEFALDKAGKTANISYRDVETCKALVPVIPDIRFKNAAVFLLGYLALGDEKAKNDVIEKCNILIGKFYKISIFDILRYAKLIKRIKGID